MPAALRGVFPVLATPFNADFSPDERGLRAIARYAIEAGADGIVHVANQGIATWYDVAIRVYSVFESDHLVHPCTSSDSPAPAPRPLWSVLDTSRMEKLLGYALPTWQDAITRFLTSKSLTHS